MGKLYLRILCKEDVKLTTALTQVTNAESIDYISGSAIRGAFIKNYLEITSLNLDEDKKGQDLFLNGDLEFRNGYKEINKKRSMPIVKGLHIEKKDKKLYGEGFEVNLKNSMSEDIKGEYKKFTGSSYLDQFKGNVKGIGVEKAYNLHINKERKEMFRYEGIKKGQIFISEIIYEKEEDKKTILEIIEKGSFYIGGSKGSGYGKVLIENIEVKEEKRESIEEKMIIYLASDSIFADEFGRVINYISEEELKESLELEAVELIKKECEETLIGGFNNKLGVKLPQYYGVKKGSILVYKIKGNLKEEKIKEFENRGIGLRVVEGFGEVKILKDINIEKIQKYTIKQESKKERINTSSDEEAMLQNIVNKIAISRIKKKIVEKTLENYKRDKQEVNKAQIGKLVTKIKNAKIKDNGEENEKLEIIKSIKSYLEHLKPEEKRVKEAYNQLKSLKIRGKDSDEFIKSEIDEEDLKEDYGIKDFNLNGVKCNLNEEELFEFKLLELESVFRYILRKEVE